MDLTSTYPRSVRDRFAGIVQLGRTTDKAKALLAGKLGEYHYNCDMDKQVFKFLGIDPVEYLRKVAELRDDAAIERFARDEFVSKKSPADIQEWNDNWLRHAPDPGSDGEKYFRSLRDQIAPDRSDVTTWPDLLDLDEHRIVPRRDKAA